MPKLIALAATLSTLALALAAGSQAETRLQKTFGQWRVDCSEADDKAAKTCSMQFALVTKKDKRLVFSWTILRKGKDSDANKVVVRTPTGVLLADGVSIGFEGTDPVKVNYFTCGPNACVAEFDFSDKWVKAFSTNAKVLVSYKAVNGTPLKHEIDLKQFAEGLAFYAAQLAGDGSQ